MPELDVIQELRRWLRQRLAAGETVLHLPGGAPRRPDAAPLAASPAAFGAASPAARVAAGKAVAAAEGARVGPGGTVPDAEGMRAPEPDSLEGIAAEVAACTRCRLHATRRNAVPGVGPAHADLVFVGEGPGADEDEQGEPFVGRAGQLLTKIIESVQLRREDVFITNIVKCRPPGNRDPEPDEIAACEPYLKRQLRLLAPKVICALGRHAGAALTGRAAPMAALRTGEHRYEGIRVFPTYHPAALLRNPQWKRPVWEDIQSVRREYDRRRENP